MNLLFVVMKDGSVFQMPNKLWQKAFNLECDDPSETIEAFKEITHKYWLKLQKPWKDKYKNEAEFGKEIMYNHIRHSLTAIELHKRAIEEGRDLAPQVIVIQKSGGLTAYTGVSEKKYESTRAYLAEKTKTNGRPGLTLEEKVKMLVEEQIRNKAKKLFVSGAKAGRIGPLVSEISMSDENLKALGYWKRAKEELKNPHRLHDEILSLSKV